MTEEVTVKKCLRSAISTMTLLAIGTVTHRSDRFAAAVCAGASVLCRVSHSTEDIQNR